MMKSLSKFPKRRIVKEGKSRKVWTSKILSNILPPRFLLISVEIDNGKRRILSWDCPFGRSVPMSYEQIFTLFIQRNICHWIFFISVEIENGERRILSRDCPFGRSAPMLYQLICWQQLLNKRNHGNSLKTVFVSRSPKHNKTEWKCKTAISSSLVADIFLQFWMR